MGRQGQPRGTQVYAVHLNNWKGWSQDPPLPRPHLRAGSGGEGFLLEIPVYVRPSKGKQFFFSFVSVSMAAVFGHTLACCSLELCYYSVIAVLSIMLQYVLSVFYLF